MRKYIQNSCLVLAICISIIWGAETIARALESVCPDSEGIEFVLTRTG